MFINKTLIENTMASELMCITCKKKLTNSEGSVTFNCPACKEKIVRCGHCRSIAARYVSECGFTGPN